MSNIISGMKNVTFEKEDRFFSPFAKKSAETKGRAVFEPPCPMRTEFQRDRDRIIHSKSFRRLKNKTQVFLSPEGDHYRTRLTHTLDVSQIARSICRVLCINEDLAEAMALGHDLGHTPFGHEGERALSDRTDGYFEHSNQSLRIVQSLENDGRGLNLTKEVEDGIQNHQTHSKRGTLEADAVCLADKIAYINHDLDDAIRAKIVNLEDLPQNSLEILGKTSSKRINTMISSIYSFSSTKNFVKMTPEVQEATFDLRKFLFEKVYVKSEAKIEENRARLMIETLYDYIFSHPEALPLQNKLMLENTDKSVVVCDYISSMTDRYAVHIFQKIFIPKSWSLL